jgi:uncharacterized protein (DUF2141 family)
MSVGRTLLAALSLVAALGAASAAEAARLIVTIEGLRSAQGYVYVALYSQAERFPDGEGADRYVRVRAATRPITVVFDRLGPGRYAVGAYHDENANGRLDTTLLGYPDEGYALSNGIRAVTTRPRFQDAAFAIGAADRPVTLRIGY